MNSCTISDCDDEASLDIAITGEATSRTFCMQHGQEEKRRLDAVLVPYTSTSIVKRDPSEKELLADSYGKLQGVHTENEGLRKAVTRLERELNVSDQDRQRLGVELIRAQTTIEAMTEGAALARKLRLEFLENENNILEELAACHELLDAAGIERPPSHERVEGGEVEPLAGVNAGADPNRPTVDVQGGEPPARG